MSDKRLKLLIQKYNQSNKNSQREKIKYEIIDEIHLNPKNAEDFLEKNIISDKLTEIIQTEILLIKTDKNFQKDTSNENNQSIDFKRNLKIYWNYLKNYKFLIILTLILVIIAQIFSLFERFLFAYLIDILTQYNIGEIFYDSLITQLIIIATIFIISIIIIVISNWFYFHLMIKFEQSIIKDMKNDFFSHIIKLDHKFHTEHSSGKLISKMDRGVYATEMISNVIIYVFLPAIISFLIVFSSVLFFDISTAITILITVTLLLSYNFYLLNKMKIYKIRENKAFDFEKGFISDSLDNIESIKFYSKEILILKRLKLITSNVFSKTTKFLGFYRFFESIDNLIIGIGTFFIILFPILKYLNGELGLGAIVFIYTSFGSLIFPVLRFSHASRNFYESMADMQQLFDYSEIENKIKNKKDAKKIQITQGKIEFNNVVFNYDNNEKIIKNFSLIINPKEKVAFVGESGGGKSTLIKLLYRFYDVKEGSIKIDGIDIRDISQESLRDELSIVPQETLLFDDTLYNNILFSRPDARREEVFSAIKFAKLNSVIENLPKKENTIVGIRGIKLSGGQKQRVSIARALLANKKILLLDEATSSLDSKLESEIQKELKLLMKGRTSIVIAHRLSTIMNADKIVVIDKGKVEAIGTHNELIKNNKKYQELWNLQKGGFIE